MGSGKESVLLLPPYPCCWDWVCSTLFPTSKRTFGQPSSCALSRSFRALVFLLTLRFLLQYLHSLVLREFGLLTRSTRSSRLSSVCDPQSPRPFPPPSHKSPRPRCSFKGLGYLGPQARDTERQQLPLYRRSSANVLS